ncbi:MAG: hypothetical protein ACRD19_01790, partial [Terriglobia bacterium]
MARPPRKGPISRHLIAWYALGGICWAKVVAPAMQRVMSVTIPIRQAKDRKYDAIGFPPDLLNIPGRARICRLPLRNGVAVAAVYD